jgi:hypothetical protein
MLIAFTLLPVPSKYFPLPGARLGEDPERTVVSVNRSCQSSNPNPFIACRFNATITTLGVLASGAACNWSQLCASGQCSGSFCCATVNPRCTSCSASGTCAACTPESTLVGGACVVNTVYALSSDLTCNSAAASLSTDGVGMLGAVPPGTTLTVPAPTTNCTTTITSPLGTRAKLTITRFSMACAMVGTSPVGQTLMLFDGPSTGDRCVTLPACAACFWGRVTQVATALHCSLSTGNPRCVYRLVPLASLPGAVVRSLGYLCLPVSSGSYVIVASSNVMTIMVAYVTPNGVVTGTGDNGCVLRW